MTNGEFERLIERYKNGNCTPEEVAYIESWVELNSKIAENNPSIFDTTSDSTATEEEMWSHIQAAAGLTPKPSIYSFNRWLAFGVAASLALMLGIGYLFYNEDNQTTDLPIIGLETYNASLNEQRIILPDSSIVTLAEGASIITDENYGENTRTVHLTGQAFFEINRNPNKPFLVYSGDLVTEVMGTSFLVKPEQNKKAIEVSVVTGKVSVYVSEKNRMRRKSGVIIIPNQKVVFNTKNKTIRQDIVDDPRIVVTDAPSLDFKFDTTPVNEVLETLRHAYGIDIVLSNSGISHCKFTGDLNGFDLFQQLNYICDVIDAQYEVRGTTIFLNGSECESSD